MQLNLTLDIPPLARPITYTDPVLLTGSCFTEHISGRLQQHKFKVRANPNGVLFNPLSVAKSLDSYIDNKVYTENDLFFLNELWNSWDHHTSYSHIDKEAALEGINRSVQETAAFIKEARFVIITLGSAFQYYLKDSGQPVSNNHRAPAQWFEKMLITSQEISAVLQNTLTKLFSANPAVQVIFTISPVRHIRDGVVENNRSKARLIEAVHELCRLFENVHYFPAYELVIDILRDYRYYDIDFVHPNYMATSYVWEHFADACIAPQTKMIMEQVHEIITARNHKARFPQTEAHRKFRDTYKLKIREIMAQYPYLDLEQEFAYFSN